MNNAYLLMETDPTYQTLQVIGVYEAKGLAIMAMEQCTERLSDRMKDRGVSYRVDEFEIGKLYFQDSA